MLNYKEVADGLNFNGDPVIKGVMYNDNVEITFDDYYEPQSCAMFLYKTVFDGQPIEFSFVGYSTDESQEHRTWIGPVCKVILPFSRGDQGSSEIIEQLPAEEKKKIGENVSYALLHFDQFRGSNPPYPEQVVLGSQAKAVLGLA